MYVILSEKNHTINHTVIVCVVYCLNTLVVIVVLCRFEV